MRHCNTSFGLVSRAAVLLAAVGCGGSGMYPVEGKIMFTDGKPATELAGGTVMFESQAEKNRVSALGEIDKQGTFRLTTSQKNDGAPAGKYKVLVAPPEQEQKDDQPKIKRQLLIDPSYQKLETTDLEVVIETKRNEVVLKVKRAKR